MYIDLRLKLAEGLRARRIRRRLTQIELAKAVQSSQSRICQKWKQAIQRSHWIYS